MTEYPLRMTEGAGFPDGESMRISRGAIDQAHYIEARGELKRELSACLRTGRALREPQARTRGKGKKLVTDEVMIKTGPTRSTTGQFRAIGRAT